MSVEANLIVNLVKQKVNKIEVIGHRKSLRITVEIYANDRQSYEELLSALSALARLDPQTVANVVNTAKTMVRTDGNNVTTVPVSFSIPSASAPLPGPTNSTNQAGKQS